MRRATAWLILLLLAACHRSKYADEITPPEAYVHFEDRLAAYMRRLGFKWRMPCVQQKKEQGTEIITGLPTDQCVKMTSPQRFRGLWHNEFEGQRFCPAPANECSFITPGEVISLDFSSKEMRFDPRLSGELYEIDFIGRRNVYPGYFGHGGGATGEVIVDRIISVKKLKAPPPPTREQVRAYLNERDRGRKKRLNQ